MTCRLLAGLACLALTLTLLPAAALADSPQLALWDNDADQPATSGTDYNYDLASGIFTIIKGGNYTLSMLPPATTTSHRVEVDFSDPDSTAVARLTLKNVRIAGSYVGHPQSGPGVLTTFKPTILTLEGDNRLENQYDPTGIPGTAARGIVFMHYSPQITGGGSLSLDVPQGTGIFMGRIPTLEIAGGTIRIRAKTGVDYDGGSSGSYRTNNRYAQSGGDVHITAGGDRGMNVHDFALSDGSLLIDGEGENAIDAKYTSTVSGGKLTINGDFRTGIFGYRSLYGGTVGGDGRIRFTGGVTDITVGANQYALLSSYSEHITGGGEPVPPQPPITLGSNMRVTAGGGPVWSNWSSRDSSDPGVVGWARVHTFSSGAVTVDNDMNITGAARHVRIEPAAGGADVPKTGDDTPLLLLCGLLLFSGAGLLLRRRSGKRAR